MKLGLAVIYLAMLVQLAIGLMVLPAVSRSSESVLFHESGYEIPDPAVRDRLRHFYRKNTEVAQNTLILCALIGLLACGATSMAIGKEDSHDS